MDTAGALVQAYLHVNGYFTVAEYPVLEAYRGDLAEKDKWRSASAAKFMSDDGSC